MATLPELLKIVVDRDGSDLHISTSSPPQVRIHGHLERLAMPPGIGVSGLESDGGALFYAGGGLSGKVRVVRRPARKAARS